MNKFLAILDKEIKSADQDKFGHADLAEILRHLIEDKEYEPPYSIGLLGGWGTGKSSIKELYLNQLKSDEKKDVSGLKRKQKIKAISFNAWRYGGENMRRALLREAYIGLTPEDEGDEKLWDRLFGIQTRHEEEPKGLKEALKEFGWKTLFTLLQMLVVIGSAYFFLLPLIYRIFGIDDSFNRATIAALLPVALYPAMKYFFDPKRYLVSFFNNVTKQDLPISTALEYERVFREQLKAYREKGKGKKLERLVVFVDDLDRLSSKEMVDGLDAVRAFIEMKLKVGLVFIISCDEDRVAKALEERKNHSGRDLPGAVFDRNDARRFLDRLFQFRLEIPKAPTEDMGLFADEYFKEKFNWIAKDLETRSGEGKLASLRRCLIHANVISPRNAIQLLNAFGQAWWLAKEREKKGAGSNRPGGLANGAVTEHPLSLAAVCVFKIDFPDFYCDLQKHPDLLSHFREVLFDKKSLDEKPRSIKRVLQCYFEGEGKNKEEIGEIKEKHETLRTYLSSLQTVIFPEDLTPLIALTQDPTSRNLPGSVGSAFKNLISGDDKGFLAELGYGDTQRNFDKPTVGLIEDMIRRLQGYSQGERLLAFSALARVAERVPNGADFEIMRPLARELSESRKLREVIGFDLVDKIWNRGREEDQKLLAERLIDDFCTETGEITFALPRGANPTYNECYEITKQVVEMVMRFLRSKVVDEASQDKFFDWLRHRSLKADGHEGSFQFAILEEWMDGHQDYLLKPMGGRYPQAVIEQLQEGTEEGFDLGITLGRCEAVFDNLFESGKREELWDLLDDFIGLQRADAVSLAFRTIKKHMSGMDADSLNRLVGNMGQELADEINAWREGDDAEPKGYGLVFPLETMLEAINLRGDELSQNAELLKNVGSIASETPYLEETANLDTRILDALYNISPEAAAGPIGNWTEDLLNELPSECIAWISAKLASGLSDGQYTQVKKVLSAMYARNDVSQEEGDQHLKFIKAIPESERSSQRVTEIADALFGQIAQHHHNPNNYLDYLFPAVPILLESASLEITGNMLHDLFSNVANKPSLLGYLHQEMTGHWPEPEEGMEPYDPDLIVNIVNEATQTINSAPDQPYSVSILSSLASMFEKSIIPNDLIQEFEEAVMAIWPYNHEAAPDALNVSQHKLDIGNLVALASHVETEDNKDVYTLKEVWKQQTKGYDKADSLEVIENILNNGNLSNELKPFVFNAWMEVVPIGAKSILEELLPKGDLSQAQRGQIWLQLERLDGQLGVEFFTGAGPETLRLESFESLNENYFNLLDQTMHTLIQSEMTEVIRAQIRVFPDAERTETKNRICNWAKKHNGAKQLSVLKEFEPLDPEDKELLQNHFPKSKKIAKLKVKEED